MRHVAVLLLLAAACASTIADAPAGSSLRADRAYLAGALELGSTRVGAEWRIRAGREKEIVLRPSHSPFLLAVPPGEYRITRIGSFALPESLPVLEAQPGQALYIGSFATGTARREKLPVTVKDDLDVVVAALKARYGDHLPAVTRSAIAEKAHAGGGFGLVALSTDPAYTGTRYRHGFQYGGSRR